MRARRFPMIAITAAISLLMALMASAPSVSGQEATPSGLAPDTDVESEIARHPAHIHSGTCDDVGDVVYPLNDLQAAATVADPDATPPLSLAATPDAEDVLGPVDVVAQSGTDVDAPLDELVSGGYVINVHESADNMGTYIACGDITGTPTDGELFIELHELNHTGYTGEAELSDLGDGTTIVNVSVFPPDVSGTPVATPAS